MDFTEIPTLSDLMSRQPPDLLYHYASQDGLLGILKSKEIWASNVAFLNDSKEVEHAVGYAKSIIDSKLNRGGLTEVEVSILKSFYAWAGNAAKRYYVASFSEDGNNLSQWRAYCPPGGGYSLGIPSIQLQNMAAEQRFRLIPCVYDNNTQSRIVNQLVDRHLKSISYTADGLVTDEELKQGSWRFSQHLTQIGCVMKHSAFSDEREWRLISQTVQEPHSQLDFRSSPSRIIPFFHFKLASPVHPNLANRDGVLFTVIAGPTSERDLTSIATQALVSSLIPGAASGASEIPYRTW